MKGAPRAVLPYAIAAGLWLPAMGLAEPNLPADRWVELHPAGCGDPICTQGTTLARVSANRPPEKRQYSGAVGGPGYVFYWGGGHHSWGGNDIDAYDVEGNRWVQFTENENVADADFMHGRDASCPGVDSGFAEAGGGREDARWEYLTCEEKRNLADAQDGGWPIGYWTPLGRPMNRHSYQQMAWWPERRALCVLGSGGMNCYEPPSGDGGELIPPSTLAADDDGPADAESARDPSQPDGQWRNVAGYKAPENTINAYNLDYWPAEGTLVSFQGTGQARVLVLDADNGRWRRGPRIDNSEWGTVYSEYMPATDEFFVSFGGNLRIVDLVQGTDRGVDGPALSGHLSLEWSPALARLVIWGVGQTDGGSGSRKGLYTYDPVSDEWDELALKGAAPTWIKTGHDILERDTETGIFYLLGIDAGGGRHIDGRVYAFRLSRNQ